jgi:hypothetical protein
MTEEPDHPVARRRLPRWAVLWLVFGAVLAVAGAATLILDRFSETFVDADPQPSADVLAAYRIDTRLPAARLSLGQRLGTGRRGGHPGARAGTAYTAASDRRGG